MTQTRGSDETSEAPVELYKLKSSTETCWVRRLGTIFRVWPLEVLVTVNKSEKVLPLPCSSRAPASSPVRSSHAVSRTPACWGDAEACESSPRPARGLILPGRLRNVCWGSKMGIPLCSPEAITTHTFSFLSQRKSLTLPFPHTCSRCDG